MVDIDESGMDQNAVPDVPEWEMTKKKLRGKIKNARAAGVYKREEPTDSPSHPSTSFSSPKGPSPFSPSQKEPAPFPRLSMGQTPNQLSEDKSLESFEDLGPERGSVDLLRNLQTGSVRADDLTKDERRVVVSTLKGQGRTQDEISAMLAVSRRTIVSDYRWLKERAALNLKEMDHFVLAGEVYDIAQTAMQRALAEGKFRTVSQILRDMVELLQSMGVVYRAPLTSKTASLIGYADLQQGFTNYIERIGDEKDRVMAVLGKLIGGIESGDVQ